MSVSKDKTAAKTNKAAAPAELTEKQLDKVAGGNPNNQATTAQKAADKTDAYIRS